MFHSAVGALDDHVVGMMKKAIQNGIGDGASAAKDVCDVFAGVGEGVFYRSGDLVFPIDVAWRLNSGNVGAGVEAASSSCP